MNIESRCVGLRMVIVDDSSHFLDAARNLLEHDGVEVVGVASTSAEAVELAAELRPDVFLVDVDLGEESGFDLAQKLATRGKFRVVLISAYPESELSDLIAASPADGFVSKSELSASALANLLGNDAADG
jgi:DNA-binding NarL/FixJ family response regulator